MQSPSTDRGLAALREFAAHLNDVSSFNFEVEISACPAQPEPVTLPAPEPEQSLPITPVQEFGARGPRSRASESVSPIPPHPVYSFAKLSVSCPTPSVALLW